MDMIDTERMCDRRITTRLTREVTPCMSEHLIGLVVETLKPDRHKDLKRHRFVQLSGVANLSLF